MCGKRTTVLFSVPIFKFKFAHFRSASIPIDDSARLLTATSAYMTTNPREKCAFKPLSGLFLSFASISAWCSSAIRFIEVLCSRGKPNCCSSLCRAPWSQLNRIADVSMNVIQAMLALMSMLLSSNRALHYYMHLLYLLRNAGLFYT